MSKSFRVLGAAAALSCMAASAQANGVMKELWDNAGYELKTTISAFRNNLPASSDLENKSTTLYSTLTMETEAVLMDDDIYAWLNLELVATYGTLDQTGHGIFRRPNDDQAPAHWLDAKRLAVHAEIMDGEAEVILGKELIEYGVAESFSPTNRFGMSVAIEPSESDAHGVWQAGIKLFKDDDSFEYRLIPFHERGASANGDNRWKGFIAQDGDTRVKPIKLKNTGHLVSYNAVRQGYDWFVLAHHGQAAYPILTREGLKLYSDTPNAWSFGGGFSIVKEEWKFYGEGLTQITDHDLDQDFFNYSVGFSYRETDWANEMGLEELTYYLEYAGEAVLDQQKERDYLAQNSYNYRQNQDTLLPKLEVKVNDTWSGTLSAGINMRDHDYSYGAGIQYKESDNLKMSISYTDFNGAPSTFYGNWDNNDVFKANLTYKF